MLSKKSGVVEPDATTRNKIRLLLKSEQKPDRTEIGARAVALANIAKNQSCSACMIGGAPYLFSELEKELKEMGVQAFYAFSKRESVEEELEDGSVVKSSIFRHVGFVSAG